MSRQDADHSSEIFGRFRVVDLSAGLWPELLQEFVSRLPPLEARVNALGPALLREVLEPSHSFHAGLIAPRGRGLVGLLGGYCVMDEVEIHTFFLDPDFRDKGLGTGLLGRLLESCSHSGISSVHLEVRSRSPARTLYKRMGFCQVGVRKGYYGPEWSVDNQSDDAVAMMYTVAPSGNGLSGRKALIDHLSGDLPGVA